MEEETFKLELRTLIEETTKVISDWIKEENVSNFTISTVKEKFPKISKTLIEQCCDLMIKNSFVTLPIKSARIKRYEILTLPHMATTAKKPTRKKGISASIIVLYFTKLVSSQD